MANANFLKQIYQPSIKIQHAEERSVKTLLLLAETNRVKMFYVGRDAISLHFCQQSLESISTSWENKKEQVRFNRAGLERFPKLTFIIGFLDTLSIRLQQALNIETLTMGNLIARTRVLTTSRDQSQDVVATVHTP